MHSNWAKIENFEEFFKYCVCLIDYLWSKFQQDQIIFGRIRGQKISKRGHFIHGSWLNQNKKLWKFLISQLLISNQLSKMSQKNHFFCPISTISKKLQHIWCIILLVITAKFKMLLGISDQKSTQKQPKMTVSTNTKTFENLNLENYRSHISKTCSVCVPL